MKRKNFIQASGAGIALAFIPGLAPGRQQENLTGEPPVLLPKIAKDKAGMVLNVIGDIQTHKLAGSDTANQLVEWVSDVEPGVGIPPHIHTKEDEVFRVISGQVEIMTGDKTTVLKSGDIAYAPRNVVHSWKVVGTEKARMITSAFPAGIESMFRALADLPAGPPDFEQVTRICGDHGITFV